MPLITTERPTGMADSFLRALPRNRFVLALAAPALALVFSLLLTMVVLLTSGAEPFSVFVQMGQYGLRSDSVSNIVNNSIAYYLAGLAVAVTFRMKLFNIGVDGQYRLAAMLAAAVAGTVALPPVLSQVVTILVAMLVGGMWAGIAGLLKVTRGVNEVISTIMLNFVATGVVAFLLRPGLLGVQAGGSNNIGTPTIPPGGRVPGLPIVPQTQIPIFGLVLLAIAAGVAFHFLINRSQFGFDLRATGQSPTAALATGVPINRMVFVTMALSGAMAGLVGMPQLLGSSYTYSLDFPAGIGFTGIAIALLGRNNPIGIALGALLWSFLDQSSLILDLNGIAKEIVIITQGSVVLSVVVAYELVRRVRLRQDARAVGTPGAPGGPGESGAPPAKPAVEGAQA